ncbi:EAL domain-containing protein [Aestuariibacter sp. A3R04]|nr:EAL domain-containing protein [Aestuariibacter sp. A3R04]
MFKSMKWPLALVVAGAIAISVCILFFLSLKEHESQVTALQRDYTFGLAAMVAEDLSDEMRALPLSVDAIKAELNTLSSQSNVIAIHIFDADRQLVTYAYFNDDKAVGSEAIAALPVFGQGAHVWEKRLVAVKKIDYEGRVLGNVVITSQLADFIAENRTALINRTLPYVFLIVCVFVLFAVWMMGRYLKPLQALSRFTESISQSKNYTARFEHTAHYEVARLGKSINSFIDTIEVELTINQEQNDTLVEQQQTMMRLANYDSLTGLPNRQFVVDNLRLELARVRRSKGDLALIFFDLDGFKGINDSLGHETGDLILIEVADRVNNLLCEGDLVARLGGDEFIIVPDREVADVALHNLAQNLIDAFTEPFFLRGMALTVGVSVGIAKASDANFELSQLMSNADLAMYRSKARGRGTYTLFTMDMVESHKRKMSIANSIDNAVQHDELLVYYQPKIDMQGDIVGLEALIRWRHPEFGLIMPGEFIPIAEQGGKVSAITYWMMERVCMELPDLQMLLPSPFRVAINLSGHDLRHTNLFDDIHALFERYQVDPQYFEFEVTESAYLENFANADRFFKRLSNLGCTVALDDFGTGYSSLSYLTRITIDTLKIDRQFIRDMDSSNRCRLVTSAIIDLANRLSLTVCAEGIEHASQWQYLAKHGCDHMQGFLFSRPVPLGEMLNLPDNFSHLISHRK